MMKRALLSVSDKKGIVDFAKTLCKAGIEIIATGGTAQVLKEAGITVTDVSAVTGFPEMMEGRVKTLHPKIHGALLARRDNPLHAEQAETHDIRFIDLLAVNLYPFRETIAKPDVTPEEAIENIDIGGPAMIRSAAKNYRDVCVLTDPDDYAVVAEPVKAGRELSADVRYRLMVKAFQHTAEYDRMIAGYFQELQPSEGNELPGEVHLSLKKIQPLRYGENPQQQASFYLSSDQKKPPFRKIHGKELSYNNLLDMDACARLVCEFTEPGCIIVKHNNPCGAATGKSLCEAYTKARATDPMAAFGGIVGFNGLIDADTARELSAVFVEVILASGFEPAAAEILQKKKNVRLIEFDYKSYDQARRSSLEIRPALNGYLLQSPDTGISPAPEPELTVVSQRPPAAEESAAMRFTWKIVRHVKSNAIVLGNASQTFGIGAGQMSRIDSVKLAVTKAREAGFSLKGAALASDAFFPFPDNIDEAAKAGITAVIQPGGSVNDREVLEAVNRHGMTMALTHTRHFRH